MNGRGPEELEIGPKGFRARGYDLLVVICTLMTTVTSTVLYKHTEDAKDAAIQVAATNREVAQAIKESNRLDVESRSEMIKAINFSACINATPEAAKPAQYLNSNSMCSRLLK